MNSYFTKDSEYKPYIVGSQMYVLEIAETKVKARKVPVNQIFMYDYVIKFEKLH